MKITNAFNEDRFKRSAMLLSFDVMNMLSQKKIAIFGIGGVGSFALEALARTGIGSFVLIDNDIVDISNINRQIIATTDTIAQKKVDVAKRRILSINPDIDVTVHDTFYLPGENDSIVDGCDYVIDAIDTVSGKIGLVLCANERKIPIISAMGCGNKLDNTLFEISDIYKTSVCPLCKVMRNELKKRNVENLKVVYSKEKPAIHKENYVFDNNRRHTPGSVAYVPSVAGLIIAGTVINDLVKIYEVEKENGLQK